MIAFMMVVFRYVGIVLIIFSIMRLIQLKKMETSGVEVEAVVVTMKENKVRTGRQVYDEYTPILEYTIEEKVYHTDALATQGDKRYELGQIVRIRCKTDNPEDVLIVGDQRYFFNAVIIGIAGVAMEILPFIVQ